MTLILDLTPEQESRLSRKAARLGLDLPEYVKRLLDSDTPTEQMPKTGAEAVAYWEKEGVFGTFANRPDSLDYARKMRERAQARKW
jgi:hypothetical protein